MSAPHPTEPWADEPAIGVAGLPPYAPLLMFYQRAHAA